MRTSSSLSEDISLDDWNARADKRHADKRHSGGQAPLLDLFYLLFSIYPKNLAPLNRTSQEEGSPALLRERGNLKVAELIPSVRR